MEKPPSHYSFQNSLSSAEQPVNVSSQMETEISLATKLSLPQIKH